MVYYILNICVTPFIGMEEREIPLNRWLYQMPHFVLIVQPLQRHCNLESGPKTVCTTGFQSGVLNLQNTEILAYLAVQVME